MIKVVGMGAKAGDVTLDGVNVVRQADFVVAKSERTHVAEALKKLGVSFTSCDDLYDSSDDFDLLNAAICRRLCQLSQKGEVAFCVCGDGSDDSTVSELVASGVAFERVFGVSDGQAVLAERRGGTFKRYTATEYLAENYPTADSLVITAIDNKMLASEIKLKLLTCFDYETEIAFGCENVKKIPLGQLDRQKRYDYRTCVFVERKSFLDKHVHDFRDVVEVMARLRAKDGCPWDRVQTHDSLKKNAVEEAYELAAAVDEGDLDHIVEELGDLLMQVVFHVEIAEDEGEFSAVDVYSALVNKLVSRHTHVFGDKVATSAEAALSNWDAEKQKQHKIANLSENVADVPRSMAPLMRAQKVQKRASKGGYDFENVLQAKEKLLEEIDELLAASPDEKQSEGGDLLFAAVNVARLCGVDCETALLRATDKFVSRVTACEKILESQGKTLKQLTPEQFDELWEKVKRNERN